MDGRLTVTQAGRFVDLLLAYPLPRYRVCRQSDGVCCAGVMTEREAWRLQRDWKRLYPGQRVWWNRARR